MLTNKEATDIGWYSRNDDNAMWFLAHPGRIIYRMKFPGENETRTFFQIIHEGITIYVGDIPDKETLILLMKLLRINTKGYDETMADLKTLKND
jgi:hypothetical protein